MNINRNWYFPKPITLQVYLCYFFNKDFCPQDMIGLLRSNLRIFLLGKFGVVWVYIDLRSGSTFIHPRFIHTEKRVDKIPTALTILQSFNYHTGKFSSFLKSQEKIWRVFCGSSHHFKTRHKMSSYNKKFIICVWHSTKLADLSELPGFIIHALQVLFLYTRI